MSHGEKLTSAVPVTVRQPELWGHDQVTPGSSGKTNLPILAARRPGAAIVFELPTVTEIQVTVLSVKDNQVKRSKGAPSAVLVLPEEVLEGAADEPVTWEDTRLFPTTQDGGIFRGHSEKEVQIMCSVCTTIWVMVDGVLEPLRLCTQPLFGC